MEEEDLWIKIKIMKKRSVNFYVIVLVCLAFSSNAQKKPVELNGKVLFETKCAKCHGKDGGLGRFGAVDLRYSRLNNPDLMNVISNGRGMIMPQWRKKLNTDQIMKVLEYIKTLRN